MKRGKKYTDAVKAFDKAAQYDSNEAIALVKKSATAKFDETVEAHIRLGVDGRHADQQVRGAVVLPHGTGKTVRVLVFAKGDKANEAEAAGADYVGAEDLIPKIQNDGWFEFDVVVATPDMMAVIGRVARILGPKGLLPNPKAGSVTMDVVKAVRELKEGKRKIPSDNTISETIESLKGDSATSSTNNEPYSNEERKDYPYDLLRQKREESVSRREYAYNSSSTSSYPPKKKVRLFPLLMILLVLGVFALGLLGAIYEIGTGF